MKSILLHAQDDPGLDSRLQAALELARTFSGRITCLSVTPYDAFVLGDPFGGLYAPPVMIESLRDAERKHRDALEARLARENVGWDWLHRDGNPAQMLIDESRLADIVVLSRSGPNDDDGAGRQWPGDSVTVNARTPVLSIPVGAHGFNCKAPIMVAWNGSDEAAHALRFTLPLLTAASAVHIVVISDDDGLGLAAGDACRYLQRHDITPELHERPSVGGSVAAALLAAARDIGAGAIVMGAYGRSRMMEALLGGTTRSLVKQAPLPLILAH